MHISKMTAIAIAASTMLAAPAIAYDWNGFYAGVHGGAAGVVHATNLDPDGLSPNGVFGGGLGNGVFGGVQVGVLYDMGAFVVGAELSGSVGPVVSSGTIEQDLFGPPLTAISEEVVIGPRGRLVGRAGFEIGDGVLLSIDGGLAFATIETSGVIDDPIMGVIGEYGAAGDIYFGPSVGARIDVAFTDNITGFVEADASWYSGVESEYAMIPASPALSDVVSAEVKAGLNFHF